MRIDVIEPPRVFGMGSDSGVRLSDCAHLHPAADEQVTFITETGAEYDVARKEWGYYATPSLNDRLAGFGLRAVLVRNREARYYLLLVEQGQESGFQDYVQSEELRLVCWLDSTERLEQLNDLMQAHEAATTG